MRAMLALAPLAAFLVALLVAWLLLTPAGRRVALDLGKERADVPHDLDRVGAGLAEYG